MLQVANIFSQEYSFVTGPPVGRDSAVKFLATADLGHAQTDGSTEIDHAQAKDILNTTPQGTLQYVSPLAPQCKCSFQLQSPITLHELPSPV